MLDVEQELREGKIYTPEAKVFSPSHEDVEYIPFVTLGLTDKLKVKLKAEQAAKSVLDESEDQHLSDIELRNKLIYWAVVFGLSLDDEAAYKRKGQELVESYIEHGPLPFDCYESLGLEILTESGLDTLLPLPEEEAEEPELDGTITTDLT